MGKLEHMAEIERQKKEKQDFKERLERTYGTGDKSRKDTLFDFAWSYGHACGLDEVEFYYSEMSDLLFD
jgi:hypothetical protein